jgi:hypothetical protein
MSYAGDAPPDGCDRAHLPFGAGVGSPYQSVRSRSLDFGQVGFEPEQVLTALNPALYLGF